MDGNKVLDVREIDKPFRKRIILTLFDELNDGSYLDLISEHSLAPLKILFQKEKQGFFEWKEIENGPGVWKISVKKVKSLSLTINDILKHYPLSVEILENHGIAYYKLGEKKLSELSKNAQTIFEEIKSIKQYPVNALKTGKWSISFTIDYIMNNHHTYVKEKIPEIENLINHLVLAHASTHPQLPMINERYGEFKVELTDHMKDEEDIVFPSFKKLENDIKSNQMVDVNKFTDSISWMEEDHILTGTSLKSMRNFCNNYIAPVESSPGFKILFEELKKFEMDMHFHMHLENNVLFTKVQSLLKEHKNLLIFNKSVNQ